VPGRNPVLGLLHLFCCDRPTVLCLMIIGIGEVPGQFLHQLCIDQCYFVPDFGLRRYRNRVF
jgi:hypothetical protein